MGDKTKKRSQVLKAFYICKKSFWINDEQLFEIGKEYEEDFNKNSYGKRFMKSDLNTSWDFVLYKEKGDPISVLDQRFEDFFHDEKKSYRIKRLNTLI